MFSYTGFKTKSTTFSGAELVALSHSEEAFTTSLLDHGEILGGSVFITYSRPYEPAFLKNIMAHKIFTYRPEKPADYYYGKTGDWKDYWRDLFAKRKARRAERKEARLLARAERRALMDDGQNPAVSATSPPPASITIGAPPAGLAEVPASDPDWTIQASPLVNINVSPNPFQQQLHLSLELTDNSELDLYLVDANGRLLYSWELQIMSGKQPITLDLEGESLPAGAYFLRVVSGDRLLKTVSLLH